LTRKPPVQDIQRYAATQDRLRGYSPRWSVVPHLELSNKDYLAAAAIVMVATLAANTAHLARLLAAAPCPPS